MTLLLLSMVALAIVQKLHGFGKQLPLASSSAEPLPSLLKRRSSSVLQASGVIIRQWPVLVDAATSELRILRDHREVSRGMRRQHPGPHPRRLPCQ